MMSEQTEHEKGVLAMVRFNKANPVLTHIDKKIEIGRLEIKILWRSSKNLWGRFGGGWNWIVGIEVGGSTVILNLLILSIRFSVRAKQ